MDKLITCLRTLGLKVINEDNRFFVYKGEECYGKLWSLRNKIISKDYLWFEKRVSILNNLIVDEAIKIIKEQGI